MEKHYFITFNNVHDALRFEEVMGVRNIDVAIMPLPRFLDSSCGFAARFKPETLDKIKKVNSHQALRIKNMYLVSHADKLKEPRVALVSVFT